MLIFNLYIVSFKALPLPNNHDLTVSFQLQFLNIQTCTFYFRVHNSTALNPILSQINPIHILIKIHFNIIILSALVIDFESSD